MTTTILPDERPTISAAGDVGSACPEELLARYGEIVGGGRLQWTEYHVLTRRLGAGGQGVVYLTERRGSDSFTLPVALKIFSPERYETETLYEEAMNRIAAVAARVAQIQQDNLLDVQNFVEQRRIRIMEMEWIDGYDLSRLLAPELLAETRSRVGDQRWKYLNDVIVTAGPVQSRIKPGVAIAIVRECLAGLAALHREGIVHGDIKTSNIMVKRTGNAKLIDIGSAHAVDAPAPRPTRRRRCSRAATTRRDPTWRASATCSSRCSRASPRSPACGRSPTCSRPSGRSSTACRTSCRPT
jgi:serine/threonine-protein kinase